MRGAGTLLDLVTVLSCLKGLQTSIRGGASLEAHEGKRTLLEGYRRYLGAFFAWRTTAALNTELMLLYAEQAARRPGDRSFLRTRREGSGAGSRLARRHS